MKSEARAINERPLTGLSVNRVKWKTPRKEIRLSDGRVLPLSVSTCIGEGDEVISKDGNYAVRCQNGDAKVLPLYLAQDTLACGAIVIPVKIKEIETQQEFDAFQQLSEFHYRGQRLHGRTSVLIVTTDYPLLPAVMGYVQLATPFFMSKCRSTVVDTSVSLPNAAWERWDKATSSKFIHLFVRVARAVVHPEFRGLGLGQILIKHARTFARDHWHVAGWKPLFLEIVADMLKYVPFAEKGGMHFAGLTEGNLHRVARDMTYLLGARKRVLSGEVAREDSVGVVDLQVSYMTQAMDLMKRLQLKPDQLGERLAQAMSSLTLENYEAFQSIIRLPKPSYMCGTTEEAEKFVVDRLNQLRLPVTNAPLPPPLQPLDHSITFSDVTIYFRSQVSRTKKTQAVQKAFGVNPGELKTTVVRKLDLTIKPKSILLICGASGSGKTTLVDLLAAGGKPDAGMFTEGTCFVPKGARVGILEPVRSRLPIIQLVGGKDTSRAIHVLNLAGLTEAFLYFRRFDELSAGQQYRFMLARLIDSGANVWVADEFCSTLDEVTASIVAHNLQRHARRLGVTVVVAAPHYQTFLRSLRPDGVLKLSSAWEWKQYLGSEFIALANKNSIQVRDDAKQTAAS